MSLSIEMRVERERSGVSVRAVVRKFIVERSCWTGTVVVGLGMGWEECFRLRDLVVRKGIVDVDVRGERSDKAVLINVVRNLISSVEECRPGPKV
jgi:hypothetical protein